MNIKLYIVRDEMTGSFGGINLFPNEEFAKRWFHDYIIADRLRANNPQDFSLWCTGEYNAEEGTIKANKMPQLIERGQKNG